MRRNLKILFSMSVAGFCLSEVQAIVPEATKDQYQTIPERNAFALRPPPSQALPTNTPTALPKITLTGITTILDNKRALMKVAPANAKQVDPTKELSLILTEGQREGDIEVLQIDEKAGSVKVNNSGTVMVLTFEKDGAKLPATATPPGTPGGLPVPTALPGGQATNPFALPARGTQPGALPTRNPRFATPPIPGVATVNPSPVGGVPTPTGVAPSPAQNTATPALSQDLTPEEQAIVMEIQRQANTSTSALIPPTPLTVTPGATQPAQTAPGQTPANPALPGRPPVLVPQ